MNKSNHVIMGIHIQDRVKQAPEVQKLLTDYGCYIKTRLGLHEADDDVCAANGLILLELVGDQSKSDDLAAKLNSYDGVDAQKMIFVHD
ncbi:hypothetical protein GF337_15870 [candidate division KSB1 bacterium]|nr:hypothetical protein [candidate division KSB1 bacterium]